MKTLPFNSRNSIQKARISETLAKKTPKLETEEDKIWKQIQIIYTFLQKPNSWFTGLSIKNYLKKAIFGKHKITNPYILSGRWSAYAHFSYIQSFQNLLNKFQLTQARVLVHPLTPDFLVQKLIERKWQIDTLDIDKNTLNWNFLDFSKQLENGYDLVIFYSFNGLVEEISQAQEILKQKVIPAMLILENPRLNQETVNLLNIFGGGVCQKFGLSFWPEYLNSIFKISHDLDLKAGENQQNSQQIQQITPQNWYFSWFGENRTRSVLESHLGESQEISQETIESIFYLLVKKWQTFSFKNYLFGFLGGLFLKNKIKNSQEAKIIITKNWSQSLDLAIPDVVLDLLPFENEKLEIRKNKIKAQDWQKYFIASLPERAVGSLEVPSFFLPRKYLNYFIYTTEPKFWIDYILSYQKAEFEEVFSQLSPIHPIIKELNLPNVSFICQYILILQT